MARSRHIRTAAMIAGLAAVLLGLVCLVVQTPAVQTYIAKRTINYLEKRLGASISLEELYVRPFDAVVARDVLLLDKDPYISTLPGAPAIIDTVGHIDYLEARFDLRSLLQRKGIHFDRIHIEGGFFYLAIEEHGYKKPITNIVRIFAPDFRPGDKPKPIADKDIVDADRLLIDNFRFRLANHAAFEKFGHREKPGGIRFNDLDISGIYLRARKIKVHGDRVDGKVDHLQMKEKSGYAASHVKGTLHFKPGDIRIRDLQLQDAWSNLDLREFSMRFKDMKHFNDFLHNVSLGADIRASHLDFKSLSYFAPDLGKVSFSANLKGGFEGPVNDFSLKNLCFAAPGSPEKTDFNRGMNGEIDGSLTGLISSRAMMTDMEIRKLQFSAADVEKIAEGFFPGALPELGKYAQGERLTLKGRASGPVDRLMFRGSVRTLRSGSLEAEVDLRNILSPDRSTLLSGTVKTEELNLGTLAGIPALGPANLMLSAGAEFGKDNISVKIDSLKIDKFHALGYNYCCLESSGTYRDGAFDGKVHCSDPNLKFDFQGLCHLPGRWEEAAYRFEAKLEHANLHALNLDRREVSAMSFETWADFAEKDGVVTGIVNVNDVVLTDGDGRHDVGDISIRSFVSDLQSSVDFRSEFADCTYEGSAFLPSFVKDLLYLTAGKHLPALAATPAAFSGNEYNVSLHAHKMKEVLSFLVNRGSYVADGSSLELSIGRDASLKGKLHSDRLAIGGKYIKGVNLSLDNGGEALKMELSADELNISPLLTRDNRILAVARGGRLGLGLKYDNGPESGNKGELYLTGLLERNDRDSLSARIDILESDLRLNSGKWTILPSKIDLSASGVQIRDFSAASGRQRLGLDGGIAKSGEDTLKLRLEQFDISALSPLLPKGLAPEGLSSGTAMLLSRKSGEKGILMNVKVDSASIAGQPLGRLNAGSMWDDSSKAFKILLRNSLEGRRNIDALVKYSPSSATIEGDLRLDSLKLAYLAPLTDGIFSEMGGQLSGDISLNGKLSSPEITSKGMNLDDAYLKVDFTNVGYTFNGPFRLDSYGVYLDGVRVEDRFGATGAVKGGVQWNKLQDIRMDIHMDINEMEALNISENKANGIYGNVFATGRVGISGPLDQLLIDVDAVTAKDGHLNIPLASNPASASSELLTFKSAGLDVVDPYEEMIKALKHKEKKTSDLAVRVKVGPTQSTQAVIEIDKASGHLLTARGTGQIEIEVRPGSGEFTLGGAYNISEGVYHFSALNITKKDFTINEGSSVKFNGDVMQSELDISAGYRTKASISTLIADTSSVSTRKNVICGIRISDKLTNPHIGLSINVQDLDPSTNARVESALNTEDKVQKQFLSLLISGGFLPDEQSGIVNNSTMLASTISEIMANQLNTILQKLDIPLDFDLDYQQNTAGTSIFDVAVSTALFHNRVTVGGTIGNREYGSSSSSAEVVGDLDIAIKLDKHGDVRLNLFSHSADQYTNYLDNLQRNGIGMSFQKEFNSFKEFFRSIFRRRRKDAVFSEEEAEKTSIKISARKQ